MRSILFQCCKNRPPGAAPVPATLRSNTALAGSRSWKFNVRGASRRKVAPSEIVTSTLASRSIIGRDLSHQDEIVGTIAADDLPAETPAHWLAAS